MAEATHAGGAADRLFDGLPSWRDARSADAWRQCYDRVRGFSHELQSPLSDEDCVVQSMPDVSPTRWHLGHTTWFFETFVLEAAEPEVGRFRPAYDVLFNSYYNSVGEQFPRHRRGLLSRPGRGEVLEYRSAVDARMSEFLERSRPDRDGALLDLIELGLHHEQQHQELMLTDIKHVFAQNPLFPRYADAEPVGLEQAAPLRWVPFDGGLHEVGCGDAGFAFDNERPSHSVFVSDFELASRPTTNGEYREFVEDGGYGRPELWLADGWSEVQELGLERPIYWAERDGQWSEFTLNGLVSLAPAAPACHLSYYEADAFARWAGARLPTEVEWEIAAARAIDCGMKLAGNDADSAFLHPRPARGGVEIEQLFGDVWEWTSSAYSPYPGFEPFAGSAGEYNGKFMCGQFVLRGGSCATPRGHVRSTYRNFFPPAARWQFSGVRLAR